MRLWRFHSGDERATAALGETLGGLLRAGDVLGLDGPLGAGKTTLTRSIAAGMGIDPRAVSSPTFTLVNEYEPPDEPRDGPATRPALAHVDAYRLAGPDDLESVDWDRLTDRPAPDEAVVIVVEWASRIEAALPPGARTGRIRIEPEGEGARRFEIMAPRAWAERPEAERLTALCGTPVQVTPCPITGQPTPMDSPTWPFANEKARMADLHRWFAGEYRLSREATEEDLAGE